MLIHILETKIWGTAFQNSPNVHFFYMIPEFQMCPQQYAKWLAGTVKLLV